MSGPMNPWAELSDPWLRRRLGKTAEELGELQAVVGRILIQGLDAIDPSSGKTNRQRLTEETADVLAQLDCNVTAFGIDERLIDERWTRKKAQMAEWEALYTKGRQPLNGDDASILRDDWQRDNQSVHCALLLVGGHDVPESAVAAWSDAECRAAQEWALREHLHASDNDDVERVAMPDCVRAHPPQSSGALDLWN